MKKRFAEPSPDALAGTRVAVIHGPTSTEDATYLRELPEHEWSTTLVLEALSRLGADAVHLDPTAAGFVERLRSADLVFVNAHGPYGEDGRLQGLLDYLDLPYTFSGVAASSIGMDKLITKAIFTHLRIRTPAATGSISRSTPVDPQRYGLRFPVMVKAVDGGSSLGLTLVRRPADLPTAIEALHGEGHARVFAEEFVPGRSVTVSVLALGADYRCLPPIEVVQHGGDYYDAAAKLRGAASGTQYAVPTDLGPVLTGSMERAAIDVGRFLGCRGAYRVDFIAAGDAVYALELNTVPGMQRLSNLPVAASHAGLDYDALLLFLITEAMASHSPRNWRSR